MAKTYMVLDSYTFTANPSACTIPMAAKRASTVDTFGGVAYFSWGTVLPGQIVILEWKLMPVAMFSTLVVKFDADAQVVFEPGTGTTYNVEMMDLKGKWFMHQTVADAVWRTDVELALVIISEV